jgi:hypothetical protein
LTPAEALFAKEDRMWRILVSKGALPEGEGTIQLTSSLSKLVLETMVNNIFNLKLADLN